MSRMLVLDMDNYDAGELAAICTRSWIIYGEASVQSGGGTKIALGYAAAQKGWLQIGRMVEVRHADLPPWVGVIDTPWTATLPVEVTLYPVEHLFTLRTPTDAVTITGSVANIVDEMIQLVNEGEDLFVRLGKTDRVDTMPRQKKIEQKPLWDQLMTLLKETATEMTFRPERDEDNRLYLYVDLGPAGKATSLLLHDGQNANLQIQSASVDGQIYNRVTGISSQNTTQSRLQTDPFEDSGSRTLYRLRSTVVQFRGVKELTTLEANTRASLADSSYPQLLLTAKVLNPNGEFRYLAPGNTVLVHAANLRLPGGILGWRGDMRMAGLVYDESDESVLLKLAGALYA